MPVNEFDVKHIMTKLAGADSALQMIRDIWPEAAHMLTRVHDAHADIRTILSWRADDAPLEREESPDNGPTDPFETSGPGREA